MPVGLSPKPVLIPKRNRPQYPLPISTCQDCFGRQTLPPSAAYPLTTRSRSPSHHHKTGRIQTDRRFNNFGVMEYWSTALLETHHSDSPAIQ